MTRLREKPRPMLPKGMATFLPEATARKRYVEELIFSVFRQWGYQEVITPLFEYLDVISAGLGEGLVEKGYKFVDRSTGRLMLLRPDITPQVARMVAMLMADRRMPLRLCYRANIFRHEEEHAGRAREMYQIGGELVGLKGFQAEAEIITIAMESLKALGLSDFKIALGHSEFFRGLLDSLELPLEIQQQIKAAMGRKDIVQIRSILGSAGVPKRKAEPLLAMPALFGGAEAIDRARALTKESICIQGLDRLREVFDILIASGWKEQLVVDLSEVRGSEYYTGIIFEIFVKNLGYPVGRGGRYDHLIGKFGQPLPSTGFAFDIEHVQSAWQEHISENTALDQNLPFLRTADILLVNPQTDAKRLFRMAKDLRATGCRVVQGANGVQLKEAVAYAKSSGISFVAFLKKGEQLTLTECRTGKTETLTFKALRSKFPHRLKSKGKISRSIGDEG